MRDFFLPARPVGGASGIKFSLHSKNGPKSLLFAVPGEFCTDITCQGRERGEFCTDITCQGRERGEFCTGSTREGCEPEQFCTGDWHRLLCL